MIRIQPSILLASLLVAVMMLAACGGGDEADVVARPVVRLQVGEQTYSENVYSYCWPESADNLDCAIDSIAHFQPLRTVPVTKDDVVRFVIQGEAGPPDKFSATLLDGPGGVQDFGAATEGVYHVELQDDLYRVQVDAEYSDVEGKPAYVSYVFGLQVAGIVIPTPTPLPTDTPTATFAPTATFTPPPTHTPTPPPTATDTPEATPTTVATSMPTVEPVETTASPQVIVPGATDTPETVGPVATATFAVAAATDTPVVPGVTVTAAPTLTVPPAITPTLMPGAPPLTLRFAGLDYTPLGYQFCQQAASGERECVEQPADNPSPGRISLQRGAAAQITIDGPRPNEVRIEYLSDTGIPTGQPETQPGDTTILFTITPEPGTYILSIRVTWAMQEVTYFFRVAINN